MAKLVLWEVKRWKAYGIMITCFLCMVIAMIVALWAAFTGNGKETWVFPTVMFLGMFHWPIFLGLPLFVALGAIEIKN